MNSYKSKKIILLSLFIIAVLFISIGIARGDFNDIYNKARFICLECIGIG